VTFTGGSGTQNVSLYMDKCDYDSSDYSVSGPETILAAYPSAVTPAAAGQATHVNFTVPWYLWQSTAGMTDEVCNPSNPLLCFWV
jgi:hypothetical protein